MEKYVDVLGCQRHHSCLYGLPQVLITDFAEVKRLTVYRIVQIGVGLGLILSLTFLNGCATNNTKPEDPEPKDVTAEETNIDSASKLLSIEELMSPITCKECHPNHYLEWSGSMHAYASTSPIYRAMNKRGQREVPGGLGTKCVGCHAPMAVRLGLTTDGLNMDDVPQYAHGVTCYFCHSVGEVTAVHLNGAKLAQDRTFRGPIADPVDAGVHGSVYSSLHDRKNLDSARLCGTCHGASFLEWSSSMFSKQTVTKYPIPCGDCHMRKRNGRAASTPGAPNREVHSHVFWGIDVALTPFPQRSSQLLAVQGELNSAIFSTLCISEKDGQIFASVKLKSNAVGHNWPSCEAQDRRAWVELFAYNAAGEVVFSSGDVADGQPLTSLDDPYLWFMYERLTDADGIQTFMPWTAVGYENFTLSPPTLISPDDPYSYVHADAVQEYPLPEMPDRVTLRVRIRPIGLDIIDDLISSGDLDPLYRSKMPTFDVKMTKLEWLKALNQECIEP